MGQKGCVRAVRVSELLTGTATARIPPGCTLTSKCHVTPGKCFSLSEVWLSRGHWVFPRPGSSLDRREASWLPARERHLSLQLPRPALDSFLSLKGVCSQASSLTSWTPSKNNSA